MLTAYHKEYSNCLGRDMEFKVYGVGGKPVLAIPTEKGRFYQWEETGMLDALSSDLEREHIQLFVADPIDAETVSNQWGDPYHRVRMHEGWYHYVVDELVPRIREINGTGQDLLAVGCSMGAYHAANFFLRRPDLFDGVIALSGVYDTYGMYQGYMDEVAYANDPCVSLSGMTLDHPYIDLFNRRRMVFCCGQAPDEEPSLSATRRLEQVFLRKGIRARMDYWGYDVDHSWFWWNKQMPYFLYYAMGEEPWPPRVREAEPKPKSEPAPEPEFIYYPYYPYTPFPPRERLLYFEEDFD